MSTLSNTLQKFTSDMEARDLALIQKRTSHSDTADYIIKELDRGIKEKEYKAPRRRYLGASSLGDPCSRKLQYRYMGQEKDERAVYQRDNRTFCILINGAEKTVTRGPHGFVYDRRIITEEDGSETVTGKGEQQDAFVKMAEAAVKKMELDDE